MIAIGDLPREVLQHAFSMLPLRTLFRLPFVCKQFDGALTPLFFQQRVMEYLKSLPISPQFYDPLVKSVDKEWKWVCFALSGIQVGDQIYPIAATLTKMTQPKLKAYLSGKVLELQSKNRDALMHLKAQHPEYLDLDAQIEQARRKHQAGWTETDQSELTRLREQIVLDRPLIHDFFRVLKEVELENPSLKEPKNRFALFEAFIEALEEGDFPNSAVRLAKLLKKQETFSFPLAELLSMKRVFSHTYKTIKHLEMLKDDSITLDAYSTQIFFHILCLLPHLEKWAEHVPRIQQLYREIKKEIRHRGEDKERIQRIRGLIRSLPEPIPETLFNNIYRLHGNSAEKIQWLTDHFHEHLHDLHFMLHVHLSDVNLLVRNVNPYGNPFIDLDYLRKFNENGLIGCCYPLGNPFPPEAEKKEQQYASPSH